MNEARAGAIPATPMTAPSRGRLLVVDDDVGFLSPVCEFLSEVGYQVRECASATEALEALKAQSFDLLLTDLVMPGTDGIALLRAALEIDPHLIAIVITGQGTIQTAVDAMKVGAFDYMVKPLEFKMLDQVLTRAMEVRRLRVENRELREAVEVYRLREALREAENFYRAIFENTGTAMAIIEEDSTISLMNSGFEKLSGCSRGEVEGKRSWRDFVTDDDRDRMALYHRRRRTDPNDVPGSYEFGFRDRSGNMRDIFLTVAMIPGTKKSVASLLDITERKKAEETIHAYQKALRSLALALSLVEERERRRIASDLHDTIGQTLALSRIKLGALSALVPSGVYRESVEEILQLIEQSIRYTRSLTVELSPPVLYEVGFEAAVESLAEQMQKEHGLRVDLENDGQPKPLDESVRVLLYKAVRELLINVVKHAKAHRADISIRRNRDSVEIILTDDGVGFNSSIMKSHGNSTELGFGLFNIRERLESIDGCFDIRSEPGHGTRVAITAPLKQNGQGEAP